MQNYPFYGINQMKFEYDKDKSASNKDKHGIDFKEAQAIWDDEFRIEIPAKVIGELRYLVIGLIQGKHWSVIVTYRDNNIRIISVRRSRIEEIEIYENF